MTPTMSVGWSAAPSGMPAVCAQQTAGVDVDRSLRDATLDVVVGGIPVTWKGAGTFGIARNVAG